MSLPRYPEYKDSGVAWLGEVPVHWEVKPLKCIATLNDDVLPEITDGDYELAYVDIGSVSLGAGIEKVEVFLFKNAPSRARRMVRDGDVLVSTVRTYLKAIAPVIAPPENLIASTGFAVVRPREGLCSEFIKYGLQSERFVDEVISRSTGVSYPAINASDLGRISLPAPPAAEQTAIATFLDRETAKIDVLVAEQEKLLTLLAEKRLATISHAVTKGLNRDTPMKDSGVEWLGDVPAHWWVAPLKSLVALRSGGTPSKENIDYWDGNVPWASAKDLKSEQLADTIDHVTELAVASGNVSLLPAGSVLVVVRGMILARTFPVVEILVATAINQDLKGISPLDLDSVNGKFLMWLLRGSSEESLRRLDEAGHGTKALRMDVWTSMRLPVPPLIEQAAIVTFLNQETARLDALTTEATRAIDLLKERRSALISAAVTGKIDVRHLSERKAA